MRPTQKQLDKVNNFLTAQRELLAAFPQATKQANGSWSDDTFDSDAHAGCSDDLMEVLGENRYDHDAGKFQLNSVPVNGQTATGLGSYN